MTKINRILIQHFTALLLFLISLPSDAQILSPKEIDSVVLKAIQTFNVPGIAVGIVKDNKVIHLKGYGVRSLRTNQPVDANTLFGIASNSKAFTSAALGILVDEKKISWDEQVVDYIPEFRLYDPYVTQAFTIRDLLTHRSGLGLGAGDLMIFPGSGNFTINDIIYNLRFLKPVSGFRTKFDYDNLLYIVAGQVVARVSKMSYEDFIEKQIMLPLGMTGSAASYIRLKDKTNVIDPHAPVDGVVKVIGRELNEATNAAGGLYSSVVDMCKWLIMQMNDGKYGEKTEQWLFSSSAHRAMWSMNTIIPVGDSTDYNTHFAGYGLGWFLSDTKGYKMVTHTGGLAGIVTQVTMIPELKLGIIVFTNQQSSGAFRSVTNSILDGYFGIMHKDRIKQYYSAEEKAFKEATRITGEIWKDIEAHKSNTSKNPENSIYLGTFTDKWFGEVTISDKNGILWFDSKRSPALSGELIAYKGNTFIAKWNDRSMDADAFVMFYPDENGKIFEMKMKPVSPLTDFSYDFQDLDFLR